MCSFTKCVVEFQPNANAKKAEQGTNGPRLNEHIKANVIRLVVGEGIIFSLCESVPWRVIIFNVNMNSFRLYANVECYVEGA